MPKIPAAVMAPLFAAVIGAGFAPAAFAGSAFHPVQVPSDAPTIAPDPHPSTPGMDPSMPSMASTHPDMPGTDHDTPRMSHDMPGMSDEEMAGMDHGTSTRESNASPSASQHSHANSTSSGGVRPQVALLVGFVALNGGVLLTAGLMRRRAKLAATKPSRASRPAK